MDISRVDPSLRAATKRAPQLKIENRVVLALISNLTKFIPGFRTNGVERRVIRDGDVRVRLFIPPAPTGAGLLWIHGGGLVLGAAAMSDQFCGETARDTGVTIVSVEYRVAPKHPFPAALDDVYAGWHWMRQHAAELGFDANRLAVGGQSAGGGLAACLAQRLHDEGQPPAAQWLFCPMLDDHTAADRARDADDNFVWNNRANLVGWRSYLGGDPGGAVVSPYAVAARREDLTGLPPTWLYVSDIELFHDECVTYAERLAAAGVDVTFRLEHGAAHGFEAWDSDSALARELLANARTWLGARLAA
ncbi:alpha/beta hydrolase [Microbacterium lacus]|uniref:alpha/beta hydrolase n=1 Tax=Microbacterium lacus TaxID=415217 RepID=UPI00384E32E8